MSFYNTLNKIYIKQRFSPSLISLFINPFYLTRITLLRELKKYTKELNGDLLDFGCGSKPYKNYFVNLNSYIGLDIENASHNHENEDIDVYYDGKTLPFQNNFFDSVFSTEVLEHVPDIRNSLMEIYRVLKQDGKFLLSIPFSFPEHEMPYDYRRLTKNGIIKNLEESGFIVEKHTTFGSFISVLFQLIIMYIHDIIYTKSKYVNLLLNSIFIFPVTIVGLILSYILPRNPSLYHGTILIAKKIT